MDELSLDSEIDEKMNAQNALSKHERKHHFKIDWRQLTYSQKKESYSARLLNKFCNTNSNNNSSQAENHKNEPKRILNSLDGCFKSGQLSAILGPSGAGKSTFLSTLFGSKQETAYGHTKVTWFTDNEADAKIFKRRSLRTAFLPQHDHLLHHLTVYETLLFASKIKNATRTINGKNFHKQNVKRVAKMLKLTECLDTRCGKLSGGQYKRVSIGQELLSEPDVIILDEPTSGLDAMTCLTTILTLKSIVLKHPMSIILTIHQPDIDVFNLFDHIYVIAQGGLAIYEGSPSDLVPTLAQIDLKMPSNTYNPARFIVENAFLNIDEQEKRTYTADDLVSSSSPASDTSDDEADDSKEKEPGGKNYIKRSIVSLTEAISGKEMVSRKDKKPLLNIAIQTLDGKIITSEQVMKMDPNLEKRSLERLNLLKKLNRIQKLRYYKEDSSGGELSPLSGQELDQDIGDSGSNKDVVSSGKSDYSSAGWSVRKVDDVSDSYRTNSRNGKSSSLAQLPVDNLVSYKGTQHNSSLQTINNNQQVDIHPTSDHSLSEEEEEEEEEEGFVEIPMRKGDLSIGGFTTPTSSTIATNISGDNKKVRLKRQFDKRLNAKRNCSKRTGYPIWYHAFLLTHRTWLSIIRDPIFFGIQACMHTTIPILLSVIFGAVQEEGCPRIGNFDLVDFAYSDSDNMIQDTVKSISQSIGNIGIVFFEMFVLSFSINCITALVFPLDMYVLLKEYRNGWYSLRSYFIGRTLADLPVPIVLHSIGISILYYLTAQPNSLWRYMGIITLVILASLVAQSVGLTVGALLMKSSQSAVLAAAGIVAPFFALSGFIVRIHTLPLVAQIAAKGSYLYYLLNGFIILRYGFGRCSCRVEDFEQNDAHQIPSNLHTMASMWIGTYSNEYAHSNAMASVSNKTNIDPNIDVVDKMMTAFKMANSYGHQIKTCDDVLPYAMLDFNLRDHDVYLCFVVLIMMLLISRLVTFAAIYYKIRSFA